MGRYSLALGLLIACGSTETTTPVPQPEPEPTTLRSPQVPENIIEPRRCIQSIRYEGGMLSVPLGCKPYDRRVDAPRPVEKDDLLLIQVQPSYY